MCWFPGNLNAKVSVFFHFDCTVHEGQSSFTSSRVNVTYLSVWLRWAEIACRGLLSSAVVSRGLQEFVWDSVGSFSDQAVFFVRSAGLTPSTWRGLSPAIK